MAVEAIEAAAMVRRMGRRNPPKHELHQPAPLCRLDEDGDVRAVALFVLDTVRKIFREQHHSATYVFLDPQGQVFAISERRSVAQAWVRDHVGWLVGRYAPAGRAARSEARRLGIPWIEPTVDGLVEDLVDHVRQLGAGASGEHG